MLLRIPGGPPRSFRPLGGMRGVPPALVEAPPDPEPDLYPHGPEVTFVPESPQGASAEASPGPDLYPHGPEVTPEPETPPGASTDEVVPDTPSRVLREDLHPQEVDKRLEEMSLASPSTDHSEAISTPVLGAASLEDIEEQTFLCPSCDAMACPVCGWHLWIPETEDPPQGPPERVPRLPKPLLESICHRTVWWKIAGIAGDDYDIVVTHRDEGTKPPGAPPNMSLNGGPPIIWGEWEQGPTPWPYADFVHLLKHWRISLDNFSEAGAESSGATTAVSSSTASSSTSRPSSKMWPARTFAVKRTSSHLENLCEEILNRALDIQLEVGKELSHHQHP